jgi:hypothetical protein
MRGSIATMLNKSLEGVSHWAKPTFTDAQFTSKADVKSALDNFKLFIALIS